MSLAFVAVVAFDGGCSRVEVIVVEETIQGTQSSVSCGSYNRYQNPTWIQLTWIAEEKTVCYVFCYYLDRANVWDVRCQLHLITSPLVSCLLTEFFY